MAPKKGWSRTVECPTCKSKWLVKEQDLWVSAHEDGSPMIEITCPVCRMPDDLTGHIPSPIQHTLFARATGTTKVTAKILDAHAM